MQGLTPTLLLILDGWGQAKEGPGNAVVKANTPNLDKILQNYPFCLLECAGESVGLPWGQMGNSEVGHLNIGAGRIVYQDIVRIDKSIREGDFFENGTLLELVRDLKQKGSGRLHLIGLVSDGGVHSHQEHIYALLKLAKEQGAREVLVHAILDGRDTSPESGVHYLEELQNKMRELGIGRIATLSGRYYSMDRDKRWERTEKTYNTLVQGAGRLSPDPIASIQSSYENKETDEFLVPTYIENSAGTIQDGDGVFFFNFRADRAKQLVKCFFKDFQEFNRGKVPKLVGLASMTEYDQRFHLPVAFPQMRLEKILSQVCEELGLKQLKIAETEKYAHVTYFFNGGLEEPFSGEERIMVPSPQDVPTYDYRPQMSVQEVTDKLLANWNTKEFDLVVCNFANLDMVGHTGDFRAAVQACEAVDTCVGKVIETVINTNARLLVTADHGNAEEMLDSEGGMQTSHSCNPVAFVRVEQGYEGKQILENGILGDIAPTILQMWEIGQPKEMTGKGLVES